MRLTLIGMPASGKSTIGRLLADRLGCAFVDTDKIIETEHRKPLPQLVEELGDQGFLSEEAKAVIAALYANAGQPCVIATGGSAVYLDEVMRQARERSVVVHLHAPLSELAQRIGAAPPRGIIGPKSLPELYIERQPLYSRWAHFAVPCMGDSDAVAYSILSRVKNLQY